MIPDHFTAVLWNPKQKQWRTESVASLRARLALGPDNWERVAYLPTEQDAISYIEEEQK